MDLLHGSADQQRLQRATDALRTAPDAPAAIKAMQELKRVALAVTGMPLDRVDMAWVDRDRLLLRIGNSYGGEPNAHALVIIAGVPVVDMHWKENV